jgi:hypothetical protein
MVDPISFEHIISAERYTGVVHKFRGHLTEEEIA